MSNRVIANCHYGYMIVEMACQDVCYLYLGLILVDDSLIVILWRCLGSYEEFILSSSHRVFVEGTSVSLWKIFIFEVRVKCGYSTLKRGG